MLHNGYVIVASVSNGLQKTVSSTAETTKRRKRKRITCMPVTYLLTPWSRVLLEKPIGFAANQEIPRILWNPKVHYRTHKRLAQPPSWRTTPCRLSATAHSIYLQLPSISEAVPPSATGGRAMPWWQGPTNTESRVHERIIANTYRPGPQTVHTKFWVALSLQLSSRRSAVHSAHLFPSICFQAQR